MKEKIDSYTWTKQMIAKSTPPRKLKKLFIKRYGTRNVPFLESVQRQFGYWEELLPYERKKDSNK